MKVKLSMPYTGSEIETYQVQDDYYKGNEYIDALQAEYGRSSAAVAQIFDSTSNNIDDNQNTAETQVSEKYINSVKIKHYVECNAIMMNDNLQEETIDDIINKLAMQQPMSAVFKLELDHASDDFIDEWQLWNIEHSKLQTLIDKFGEEWVLLHEPLRNLKITFLNKANESVTLEMCNCRIIGKLNIDTFIIFAMEIQLNNIEN